ncbi:MAG: SOS response-associated peptidase family protein, partial [Bacteroidetes bacterium]|nr:SOS response-associated peptidase family protein [Bacteroidota bacterium]
MCGRYVTVSSIQAVEQRFNVKALTPWASNANVSHGDRAPVVASDKPGEVQLMQFGFTPGWAKKQYYMINARAEGDRNAVNDPSYTGAMGILDKPMFRKAIRSQR